LRQLLDNWLDAIQLISVLVGLIWCVALINHLNGYAFNQFGIIPRDLAAISGVLTWVLLHGDVTHVLVNTTPLFFMGFFVALRGPRLFFKITFTVWILAGICVWSMARPAVHIGASGLVFGYFGFIVAVAVTERNIVDLGVASLTIFYYGGLLFGILPAEGFVSWESHLFGLIAGVLAAKWHGKDWAGTQKR